MKKTILLLLIIPQFLIAQKQFSSINSTWRYELHTFDCSNKFLRYNVEKEIEIDGKDCSVIYAYTSSQLQPFHKATDSLIIWENDSKIYFYQFEEFHLVFDFTLEIGDTLVYYLPTGKQYFSPYESETNDTAVIEATLFVKDITNVDVNGTILKKFETGYDYSEGEINNFMDDIVENVGSDNYQLLGSNQVIVASGCGPRFLCYENEDYSFPPDIQCEYPTSTKNIYTDNEINFAPNPTDGYLNIINNTEEKIKSVSLFDMTGQKVNADPRSKETLQLHDLNSGLYIVRLTFMSGITHTRKILKY